MLVLEQRVKARHARRGVVLEARLLHGVEARGWRMKFCLLKAEVDIEADIETYRELARRLTATNVRVRRRVAPKSVASPVSSTKPVITQPAILPPTNQMKPYYCQDNELKVSSPTCHSPGAILPDLPPPEDGEKLDPQFSGLPREASAADTQAWLNVQRFGALASTFTNYSGADLLRLQKDELVQICGLATGLRLHNALHAKRIEPRLTIYVSAGGGNIYSALYLHACRASELLQKLQAVLHCGSAKECDMVLVSGPHGARVRLTDELVRHLPDHATYTIQRAGDTALLLTPVNTNNS